MAKRRAMGSHHSAHSQSTIRLTPPRIIDALGGWRSFDLDPCAAPDPRPWPTANHMNAEADGDGLLLDWFGRVLLNPPFSTAVVRQWLERMAAHDRGTAILMARTDTKAFQRHVLGRASGLFFLAGRWTFFDQWGEPVRNAKGEIDNCGAPLVLCAYGQADLERLMEVELDGEPVPLRFARFALVLGLTGSWREEMAAWIRRQGGPISVSDAYRFFRDHPKVRGNPNWRAKVRQVLRRDHERLGRDSYRARAA